MSERRETVRFLRRRLPHWEVAEGRYFVTIRLKGAIPEAGRQRLRDLYAQCDQAIANGQKGLEERRAVFREMEHWLDRAPVVSHLARPEIASMVVDAIEHRERQRLWTVFSFVIMPSHIHLFFSLGSSMATTFDRARDHREDPAGSGYPSSPVALGLDDVLTPFKHWTALQARRAMKLTQRHFWQREWFDHWSRSPDESDSIVDYIHANPVRAGLVQPMGSWPWMR